MTAYECSACGRRTTGPLPIQLRPSGKLFSQHSTTPEGDETCKGGKPIEATPEVVELVSNKESSKTACRECGTVKKALTTPGKVGKHMNPFTLNTCEQRSDATYDCKLCQRTINFRMGKIVNHRNLHLNNRCPASNKDPIEAAKITVEPPARPKKLPKQRSADAESYKALTGLGRSQLKAKRLAEAVAPHGWAPKYEEDAATGTVTLVLSRGKGNEQEVMQISWYDGKCIGGDGRITHSYRNRIIAVRNASAIKKRAAMSKEQIQEEFSRVSTRKATAPGRRAKSPAEQRLAMPFDPKTADDTAILQAVTGRTIVWENKTAGKTDKDVVKNPRIQKTKTGFRNLSFTGTAGSRTIRIENLVSVG